MKKHLILLLGLMTAFMFSAAGHVDGRPSFHDVITDIIQRMRETLSPEELQRLDEDDVVAFLTAEEKDALASEYMSFEVNVPVKVHVMLHAKQREIPWWLESKGFQKTGDHVLLQEEEFDVWTAEFDAGRIGLGPNGFQEHRFHYFTALTPQNQADEIELENNYPGMHKAYPLREGFGVYGDDIGIRVKSLPDYLDDAALLRAYQDRLDDAQLVRVFRSTDYPANKSPDQIVLTWSDDPKTTQTVQWRTSTDIAEGTVQYRERTGSAPEPYQEAAAEMTVLEDIHLANDAVNHRFTATMRGLEPDTVYEYRVGSAEADIWSVTSTFRTAPAETAPFKFIYMGDAQNGLDTWGNLLQAGHAKEPDTAFYIMAGDLVNRGVQRDDWDSFFHNATGVYERKQLVPAIGNHEDQGDEGPWMYLELFDLPKNGSRNIEVERSYSFTYSNALFVILDTNAPVPVQSEWLEEQLANSDATWKFVVYHHPAYSSAPQRDNPFVRSSWGTLFDKYHVDMALQGHDHAYLRTYPMFNEKRVDSPQEGTIYVVSVSGTKFYDQDPRDYTEFGMTNTATYQVLDITIDGDKLVYKAYDAEGVVKDEVTIEK